MKGAIVALDDVPNEPQAHTNNIAWHFLGELWIAVWVY